MSNRGRGSAKVVDDTDDDYDKLYCTCRTPYKKGQFMIQCDGCNDWFHGSCVEVTPEMAETMDKFYCPNCLGTSKPPKRGGQFLTEQAANPDASAPKPVRDLRAEVVTHMESNLKKAIAKCREVVDQQISTGKAVTEAGVAEGAPLSDSEMEKLKGYARQLVEIDENAEALHKMAVQVEQGIFEARGSEREKPYRLQYRGLRKKLDAPSEHQYRLDLFTGSRTPQSLGSDDVSSFVPKTGSGDAQNQGN